MKKLINLGISVGLILFATTVKADFEDWDKRDQQLYKGYIILQTIDVLQTFDMIECQQRDQRGGPHCPYVERNPLVGSYPTKGKVIVFKTAVNLITYHLLDKKLSSKERRGTLIVMNAISIIPIIHNNHLGLGLGFHTRF